MKVGILTYHSQPNYGGVLQAWASQTVLCKLGYDAYVVDRYGHERNAGLWGSWVVSVNQFVLCLLKTVLLAGAASNLFRRWRTYKFIHKYLRLTKKHFRKWASLNGDSLGLDCIIVGSDQVWNASSLDCVRPYFLEGWACNTPAISYAASIGLKSLPESAKPVFREGLKRFTAISVREDDAVDILNDLGFSAAQVLDPVLLLDKSDWESFASTSRLQFKDNYCVCYFMGIDWVHEILNLVNFAKVKKCEIYVFVNDWMLSLRPTANSFVEWLGAMRRFFSPHVHFKLAADPIEFVDAIQNANWVVTDSFHALMFSAIFDRNIRFIKPSFEYRLQMFRRIEGFVEKYVSGPVISTSVADALCSFIRDEIISFDYASIRKERNRSIEWLANNICKATMACE